MEHVKILEMDDDYTSKHIVVVPYTDIEVIADTLKECKGVLPPLSFSPMFMATKQDRQGWVARACSSLAARVPYPVYAPIMVDSPKDIYKIIRAFHDGGFRHFAFSRLYGRYQVENLLAFHHSSIMDDSTYLIIGGDIEPKQHIARGKWVWAKDGYDPSGSEIP